MPTHRDVPWERDALAVHGPFPSAPGPTWRLPIATALAATLAIAVLATRDTPDAVAPSPVASMNRFAAVQLPAGGPIDDGGVAPAEGSITTLRSRFVGHTAIEISGRTTAPDGASISLQLEARGRSPIPLADVPAVAGGFHARVRLPSRIRGRSVDVRASVVS
ncbi:MAG: hypothetical protein QOE31_2890 [Solirubrobacteraceae bacterium]|nr:hypothetical protein [Solirubrobacteraceae bacterium]